VVAIAGSAPVSAQDAGVSPGAGGPASKGAASSAGANDSAATTDLPVSLDHIRDGLKKPADSSLLRGAELPADFRIEIVEQQKIDEILKKMDVKSGPAPPGGLYGYEQQRRAFNPTDRPLMQPYAAFSGAEMATLAAEGLLYQLLSKYLPNAFTRAQDASAERAAREEVDRNVAAYCATRPDRDSIAICTSPPSTSVP
jgi:hypothetical protein